MCYRLLWLWTKSKNKILLTCCKIYQYGNRRHPGNYIHFTLHIVHNTYTRWNRCKTEKVSYKYKAQWNNTHSSSEQNVCYKKWAHFLLTRGSRNTQRRTIRSISDTVIAIVLFKSSRLYRACSSFFFFCTKIGISVLHCISMHHYQGRVRKSMVLHCMRLVSRPEK